MKLFRLVFTLILLSLFLTVSPASAIVQDKSFCAATSNVSNPSVTLGLGSKGSSSLSSTSDYATIGISAGLRFNENAAATVSTLAVPALDGSTSNSFKSVVSGTTPKFSTTNSNDVIYLIVSIQGTSAVSSITNSGTALTWIQRGTVSDGSNGRLETWYAMAPTAATRTITVNFAVRTTFIAIAFGISGADITHPFDSNLAAPVTGMGTGTSQSVTISTSNPNDFLIGAISNSPSSGTASNPIAGAGFSLIDSTRTPGKPSTGGAGEYRQVTTTQVSTPIAFSTANSESWVMIGDAVQGNVPIVVIAVDTSLSAPVSSGSFSLPEGSSAFLLSPAYPNAATMYAGSWVLDLWASASRRGTMEVVFEVLNSSDIATATVASGTTGRIGTSQAEVVTTFAGSSVIVPAGGHLLAIMTNPSGSGSTFTIFWGPGQMTNFQTPKDFDYVATIANSATTPYSVSIQVYSSSSLGRLTSLAVSVYLPDTTEISVTNGVLTQSFGPIVTIPGSSTLNIRVSATANAFGTSNLVLLVAISPSAGPFCYDVINLGVS